MKKPTFTSSRAPHLTIKDSVANSLSDPAHRFHGTGPAHDDRLDVIAGEARQRVRGRHFDTSLRSSQKPAQ